MDGSELIELFKSLSPKLWEIGQQGFRGYVADQLVGLVFMGLVLGACVWVVIKFWKVCGVDTDKEITSMVVVVLAVAVSAFALIWFFTNISNLIRAMIGPDYVTLKLLFQLVGK